MWPGGVKGQALSADYLSSEHLTARHECGSSTRAWGDVARGAVLAGLACGQKQRHPPMIGPALGIIRRRGVEGGREEKGRCCPLLVASVTLSPARVRGIVSLSDIYYNTVPIVNNFGKKQQQPTRAICGQAEGKAEPQLAFAGGEPSRARPDRSRAEE